MAGTVNFSPSEILDIIGEYSKTSEGQSEIKSKLKTKEFYLAYADKGKYRTKSQMKRAAQDMADILYHHMITDTVKTKTNMAGESYTTYGLSEFDRNDIIVSAPYDLYGLGTQIDIGFDRGSLHRPSLLKSSDGIDDIVALFVHGYSGAKQSVHGIWKGMDITTRRSREGSDFLQNAVDEINAKYGKQATATIKPEYRR